MPCFGLLCPLLGLFLCGPHIFAHFRLAICLSLCASLPKMPCLQLILISVSHSPAAPLLFFVFHILLLLFFFSKSHLAPGRGANPFRPFPVLSCPVAQLPVPSSQLAAPSLFTNFCAAFCFVTVVCLLFLALRDFTLSVQAR